MIFLCIFFFNLMDTILQVLQHIHRHILNKTQILKVNKYIPLYCTCCPLNYICPFVSGQNVGHTFKGIIMRHDEMIILAGTKFTLK